MDKIKQIIHPIKDDIIAFEKELKKITESQDNFLRDELMLFLFSSPKRLRPIITILLAKILNIKSDIVQKIALVQELLHNASLIHDDIIDEDKTRRNIPTLYSKYGSKIAVLEGDVLLSMALNELAETNTKILKVFSQKIQKTILGELNQNENTYKITSIETYLEKSFNKTGNLFLAGLESLFLLDDFDENVKSDLKNFLVNYTVAFQIDNDLRAVNDIKNGNYTLSVLYFVKENPDKNPFDIKDFKESKYYKYAKDERDEFYGNSLYYLDKVKDSIYKDTLKKLLNYTLGSEI